MSSLSSLSTSSEELYSIPMLWIHYKSAFPAKQIMIIIMIPPFFILSHFYHVVITDSGSNSAKICKTYKKFVITKVIVTTCHYFVFEVTRIYVHLHKFRGQTRKVTCTQDVNFSL